MEKHLDTGRPTWPSFVISSVFERLCSRGCVVIDVGVVKTICIRILIVNLRED